MSGLRPGERRGRWVLATTPLIDGHNDLPWAIRISENPTFDVLDGGRTPEDPPSR